MKTKTLTDIENRIKKGCGEHFGEDGIMGFICGEYYNERI